MAYREFVDSCLIRWVVWHVAASRSERRERATRRSEERAEERARGDRRRRREPRPRRMRISAPMSSGWLCFESATEKRRLIPVPPGWNRMSDRGLEELCARAMAVAKTTRQLIMPARQRRFAATLPAVGYAAR